jgi:ligand-binding sensor domain-containing protein
MTRLFKKIMPDATSGCRFGSKIAPSYTPTDFTAIMKIAYFLLLLPIALYANNSDWINYTDETSYTCAIEGTKIWVGGSGLMVMDMKTEEKVFYNKWNSGLPDNTVSSIAIDVNGNKWVATRAGLAKFDGKDWKVFNWANSGLPDDNVLSIKVGNSGVIWVGTNGGLAQFDGVHWVIYNTTNSPIPENRVKSIAIDKSGSIWVGTVAGGLASLSGSEWKVYLTAHPQNPWDGDPPNSIQTLAVDDSNNIWAASEFGSFKVDSQQVIYIYQSAVSIVFDSQNILWAIIGNELFKFDGSQWSNFSLFDGSSFNSIIVDSNQNEWIASSYGLRKFDGQTWTTYSFGIPDQRITAIVKNNRNSVWIGTMTGGLVRAQDGAMKTFNTQNSNLVSNWIQSLAADDVGNIWVAYSSGGVVSKFDGTDLTNYSLANDYVTSILIDKKGTKWFGTFGSGIVKFDGYSWQYITSSNSGLPINLVETMIEDHRGNIWVGTTEGLAKFDGINWQTYGSDIIYALGQDKKGTVWVGSEHNLMTVDGNNLKICEIPSIGSDNQAVITICIDSSNTKWFGSYVGLIEYNDTNWTMFNTQNSSLPCNSVTSIAIDDSANKWIGTYYPNGGSGLCEFREGGVAFGVEPSKIITPDNFLLFQNYPNPFNSTTIISYDLPEDETVTLVIYDVLGRQVTWTREQRTKGIQLYRFDAEAHNLASGVYFYQIRFVNTNQTKKMLLLR